MSDLDEQVLRALSSVGTLRWLSTSQLASALGVDEAVVISVLGRLRARLLVDHDGERGARRRWARTRLGDRAWAAVMKQAVRG